MNNAKVINGVLRAAVEADDLLFRGRPVAAQDALEEPIREYEAAGSPEVPELPSEQGRELLKLWEGIPYLCEKCGGTRRVPCPLKSSCDETGHVDCPDDDAPLMDCTIPCTCADDGGGDDVRRLVDECADLENPLTEDLRDTIADLTRALADERAKWGELRDIIILCKVSPHSHVQDVLDRLLAEMESLSTLDRLDGGTGERKCETCDNHYSGERDDGTCLDDDCRDSYFHPRYTPRGGGG